MCLSSQFGLIGHELVIFIIIKLKDGFWESRYSDSAKVSCGDVAANTGHVGSCLAGNGWLFWCPVGGT